jgi:phospholipid/cholesterol/gamma-HCH transport system substrate-binding protein
MLTRRVRLQIGAFVVIGLLFVSLVAVRYVGLLRLFGATGYNVSMDLPTAGGLFDNAEVTYRGVPVGRVEGMQLTATGIRVKLHINSGSTKIPADLEANVADRSVIGEQYVDLVPRSDDGPYLRHGEVIAEADTTIPTSTTTLLQSAEGLLSSIPIQAEQTTVGELNTAFAGLPANLQTILASTKTFYTAANASFPSTVQLIDAGKTVLATQQATSSSIVSFSANLAKIAETFQASNSDLNALIQVTPGAAAQIGGLFSDLDQPLGLLLANLTTTSDVFQANIGGLQTILVRAPQAVDLGNKVITSSGANVGLALTFFDPLPCTSGYGATVRHSPLVTDTTPLNTAAGCSSTSSTDVRGANSDVAAWSGPVAEQSSSTPSTVPSLSALLGGQG